MHTCKKLLAEKTSLIKSPSRNCPHCEKQADMYAAILDKLDIQSAVMIGLSVGGLSALQFALRHPNRCEGIINDMVQADSIQPEDYPLENIKVPTLIIHAINDPVVPFANGEHTAQKIPNAKFLRINDGGWWSLLRRNTRRRNHPRYSRVSNT